MITLVWAETEGRVCKKASREALSEAGRMAGQDGKVIAAVFGEGAGAAAADARQLADSWLVGEAGALASYDSAAWAGALRAAASNAKPDLVLAGSTTRAREVMSILCARESWPLAPDCTRVEMAGDRLEAARPVLGGRAVQVLRAKSKPLVATVRPNTWPLNPQPAPRQGAVEQFAPPVAPDAGRVKFGAVQKKAGGRPDLTEAEIVVAGGRGLKDPANFRMVEELADALAAAVGATRAIVDAGWRDVSEQVGKSGRTVSPKLYVAAGISGAVHHLMGMDSSRVVVAIDRDKTAPIFGSADFGIVGDAMEVLPAIVKALKA